MLPQTTVTAFELLAEYKDKILELVKQDGILRKDLGNLAAQVDKDLGKLRLVVDNDNKAAVEEIENLYILVDKASKAVGKTDKELRKYIDTLITELESSIPEMLKDYVKENKDELKGDKGEKGDKGDKGDKGLDGKDGINGKDGAKGKDGLNGKDGRDGKDGKNGLNGRDGKDGKDAVLPDIQAFVDKAVSTIEIPQPVDAVGIKSIKVDGEKLAFHMTDGSTQKVDIPKWSLGAGNTSAVMRKTTFLTGTLGANRDVQIVSPQEGEVLQFLNGVWTNAMGGGGGGDTSYVRTTPMPITVGGAAAGTTFNGTVVDALDRILYPFQAPSFSSFSISGVTTREVGATMPEQEYTFTWAINNAANVQTNSIVVNGVAIVGNPGSSVQILSAVTNNTVASRTFTITAISTTGATFSRNVSVNWMLRRYWGVSVNTEVSDAEILAMSSEFASNRNKSVTYDCTGGRYFYYAYPSSFGDLTDTKVNNLSWNDWVLVKREYTNVHGIMIPFNIYRSFNLLNGSAIPVVWG